MIYQIYLSHNFVNLVRVESLESLLKILTEYHDVDHTILDMLFKKTAHLAMFMYQYRYL